MTSDDPACTDTPVLPGTTSGGPLSDALSRVSRLHRATAGKLLRCTGLYPGQELLMKLLWEAGPVPQSELIRTMELDPSTVTKMLQRLEQTGHVRRHPDPVDRRAVLVEATEEGGALRPVVEAAWSRLEERTLAGLDETERGELGRLLAKVEANLCTGAQDCPPGQPARTSSALSTSAVEL